jgi:hypothetical protein
MMTCFAFLGDPLRADVAVDSPLIAMHRTTPASAGQLGAAIGYAE